MKFLILICLIVIVNSSLTAGTINLYYASKCETDYKLFEKILNKYKEDIDINYNFEVNEMIFDNQLSMPIIFKLISCNSNDFQRELAYKKMKLLIREFPDINLDIIYRNITPFGLAIIENNIKFIDLLFYPDLLKIEI